MVVEVSVVIPVHDGGRTLRQCLDSVLDQTYSNYEVIVVDNDSTDDTKEIAKEFQEKNKRLKYVFEGYRSRGAARNAGILASKGRIITMVDSDCVVLKDWLSRLVKPIIYENEDIVMGYEKDLVGNYWTKNIQKMNHDFIERGLNGKYVTHLDTKNIAVTTSLVKKLMFDPQLVALEDFDFAVRLKEYAKIRFVPSVSVFHNHKNSFANFVMLNFDRAFWAVKIFQKHKEKRMKKEIMLESISFKNFITFPFWMILQFIKRPIGESYFLLISEISWRFGVLWSIMKK